MMTGTEFTAIIIFASAIFGIIQLFKSFYMLAICSVVFQTFSKAKYVHLTIDNIVTRTKLHKDTIISACIADKRFEQVNGNSYDLWTVGKQWKVT